MESTAATTELNSLFVWRWCFVDRVLTIGACFNGLGSKSISKLDFIVWKQHQKDDRSCPPSLSLPMHRLENTSHRSASDRKVATESCPLCLLFLLKYKRQQLYGLTSSVYTYVLSYLRFQVEKILVSTSTSSDRCYCGYEQHSLVVCVWCACGVRVVCVWCACGVRVVCVWCACGVRVVCVWCACGERGEEGRSLRCSVPCLCLPCLAPPTDHGIASWSLCYRSKQVSSWMPIWSLPQTVRLGTALFLYSRVEHQFETPQIV